MFGLFRRDRHERSGFALYGAVVGAARDPYLYAAIGAPDTFDGRFDVICLYACVMIRRLRRMPAPGPALAQSLFDAMFSDMDINLRELGVGDLSVGKRVRAMWEALHGRALVYEAALAGEDDAALADALARNVWRGEAAGAGASRLAALVRAQAARLDEAADEDLLRGTVVIPAAAAVLS